MMVNPNRTRLLGPARRYLCDSGRRSIPAGGVARRLHAPAYARSSRLAGGAPRRPDFANLSSCGSLLLAATLVAFAWPSAAQVPPAEPTEPPLVTATPAPPDDPGTPSGTGGIAPPPPLSTPFLVCFSACPFRPFRVCPRCVSFLAKKDITLFILMHLGFDKYTAILYTNRVIKKAHRIGLANFPDEPNPKPL